MLHEKLLNESLQQLQWAYPALPMDELYELLFTAYTEPSRHYHTLQHIAECLMLYNEVKHLLHNPNHVELAIWFHDVIYCTQHLAICDSNEAQSAALFKRVCGAALPELATTQIEQWILATEQHAPTINPDLQFLLDIDLAVLGASPQRFAEYESQIRAEYAWVAATVYREKRLQVLAKFAGQDPLYQTAYFQERFAVQARANLANALR